MADLIQELALLNQQAAELLQKYDQAFTRLDEKSQELAEQLVNQINDGLSQLQQKTDDGITQLVAKIQEGLNQLQTIIETGAFPRVVSKPSITGSTTAAIGHETSWTVSAESYLDDNVHIDRFEVNWGDGNTETVSATENQAQISHAFSGNVGDNFQISVVAVDSLGNKSEPATLEIQLVNNQPPTAPQVDAPTEVVALSQFTVRFFGSTDPDGDTVTYKVVDTGSFSFSKTEGIIENEEVVVTAPSNDSNEVQVFASFSVVAVDSKGLESEPTTVNVAVFNTTEDYWGTFTAPAAVNTIDGSIQELSDGLLIVLEDPTNNKDYLFKLSKALSPIKSRSIPFGFNANNTAYRSATVIDGLIHLIYVDPGTPKLLVAILDENLNLVDVKAFNTSYTPYYPRLVKLPDGTYRMVYYVDADVIGTGTAKYYIGIVALDSNWNILSEKYIYNNQSGHEWTRVYDIDVDEEGNIYLVGELRADNGTTGSSHGLVVKIDPALTSITYKAFQRANQDCNTRTWAIKYDNGFVYISGMHQCGGNFLFAKLNAGDLSLVAYFNPPVSGVSVNDTRTKPSTIQVVGSKVYAQYCLVWDWDGDGANEDTIGILVFNNETNQVEDFYAVFVGNATHYWWNADIQKVSNSPFVLLQDYSDSSKNVVGYLPKNPSNIDLLAPAPIHLRKIDISGLTNETLYHATLNLRFVNQYYFSQTTATLTIEDETNPTIETFNLYK